MLLVISCLLLVGCSRTVTQIVNYGDQMTVSVTLRGNIDVSANRYFMVLSDNRNFKVPLPPPYQLDTAPEFIEPDMTPQTGSLEAYFTNFFSAWSGYVVLDTTGYTLVTGPFVINQAPTREVLSTLGSINTTISFDFRLGELFATVPDLIYFDIIAVSWPDGAEKVPADHLPSTDNSISKIQGSIKTVADIEDPSLDPGLDIINCTVEIQ
ncbi:MAG: hypothetical protein ABID35_07705 [Candidatus Margulisiibacteriota bacterium]